MWSVSPYKLRRSARWHSLASASRSGSAGYSKRAPSAAAFRPTHQLRNLRGGGDAAKRIIERPDKHCCINTHGGRSERYRTKAAVAADTSSFRHFRVPHRWKVSPKWPKELEDKLWGTEGRTGASYRRRPSGALRSQKAH